MRTEIAEHADFSIIRYAQCWEDAGVLLDGLDIRAGDVCVSIASAGENALAMVSRGPARVIALDLSAAQLACVELRVAAYRTLEHHELLELIGSRPSDRRGDLYRRCREKLSAGVRAFWDGHPAEITAGIGSAGKFERYFALFRTRILPLVHSRATVERLLRGGSPAEREEFYHRVWNNRRWRLMFAIFFSRAVMGRFGRDPSFFAYVRGSVADKILARTQHALTRLDPSENPYLHWILTGTHGTALPYALRPENFDAIRDNIDRLEWRCQGLEAFLDEVGPGSVDRYNLSDVFEYMSPENYAGLLDRIVRAGRSGGRLAYWNMLADRHRPDDMADRLRPQQVRARELHGRDKAFFYSDFVLEEIV
ncbi:MAG: DUF3419 family protein [Capsulimonadaceae bacterium]